MTDRINAIYFLALSILEELEGDAKKPALPDSHQHRLIRDAASLIITASTIWEREVANAPTSVPEQP